MGIVCKLHCSTLGVVAKVEQDRAEIKVVAAPSAPPVVMPAVMVTALAVVLVKTAPRVGAGRLPSKDCGSDGR